MRVHILGSGGSHSAGGRRLTQSILFPSYNLVFDAGSGFEMLAHVHEQERHRSWRSWVNPLICDDLPLTIILSHYHHDHVVGLPALLDVTYQRDLDVVIRGLGNPESYFASLFGKPWFPRLLQEFDERIRFEGLGIPYIEVDGNANALYLWSRYQAYHSVAGVDGVLSLSYCVFPHGNTTTVATKIVASDGTVVVIVPDTTVPEEENENVIKFLSGVDLLIHECHFLNEHKECALSSGHSWASRVGMRAMLAQPRELLLVHSCPVYDDQQLFRMREEVRKYFPNVLTSFDGMGVDIDDEIIYFNQRID